MFTKHISGIPVSQWHMASVIRNLQSASQVQPKPSFGWYHIILLVKVCMGTAGPETFSEVKWLNVKHRTSCSQFQHHNYCTTVLHQK